MKPFRLAAVLRARKNAEDAAKTAAAQARREAEQLAAKVRERERQLDQQTVPGSVSAQAFTASLLARQSLVATLNDALIAAGQAEQRSALQITAVKEAAIRRRAMEHLEQRHNSTQQQKEEAAEDAAQDDLTGARHHRGGHPQ
jgi:flagellar protein FliJ